jgi:hypothetical protein
MGFRVESQGPSMKRGEPFNPYWKSCGFYPPETVGRNTELKLTDGQKRLYEWLVGRAGRNAEVWYPFKKIALAIGKCVRQVKHDAAVLEEKGLIAHVFHHRHPNRYRFLWHPIFRVQSTALKEDAPRVQRTAPNRVQRAALKRTFRVQPTAPQLHQEENYIRRITSAHAQPSAKPVSEPGDCATDVARVSGKFSLPKTKRSGGDRNQEWFPAFWKLYPRKVAKLAAEKAFKKHVTSEQVFQQVMRGLEAQMPKLTADLNFCPYPATWLNKGHWTDEAPPARVGPQQAKSYSELPRLKRS